MLYICVCMHDWLSVWLAGWMDGSMYVRVYMYDYVYIYIYLYLYLFIFVYIYLYLFLYIYLFTFLSISPVWGDLCGSVLCKFSWYRGLGLGDKSLRRVDVYGSVGSATLLVLGSLFQIRLLVVGR